MSESTDRPEPTPDPMPESTPDRSIASAPDEPRASSGLRARRRVHPAWLVVAVLVVAVAVGGVWFASRPQEYRVDVPAGTGERIAAGEQVELIPRDLQLSVGDTMIIENQDQRNHTVGPFAVRAGETLRYTFSNPGIFKGACSIHPSGDVTITVS
ncbi:MAG: hypothetical protein R2726_16730 [Acidimicrobiales bacterium]